MPTWVSATFEQRGSPGHWRMQAARSTHRMQLLTLMRCLFARWCRAGKYAYEGFNECKGCVLGGDCIRWPQVVCRMFDARERALILNLALGEGTQCELWMAGTSFQLRSFISALTRQPAPEELGANFALHPTLVCYVLRARSRTLEALPCTAESAEARKCRQTAL